MQEERYQLIAWVNDGGSVTKVGDEGTSTFTQIFCRRPDGGRYGILYSVKEDYFLVDMLDCEWTDKYQRAFKMCSYQRFATLDAAIAAGVLTE